MELKLTVSYSFSCKYFQKHHSKLTDYLQSNVKVIKLIKFHTVVVAVIKVKAT